MTSASSCGSAACSRRVRPGVPTSGSLSAAVPRQDALTAAVTFASAVVLACAALYLEYCCRVPDAPDRDRADEGARLS